MATATIKNKKEPLIKEVTSDVLDSVTITLSIEEALVISAMCAKIGGSETYSVRKYTKNVRDSLLGVGIDALELYSTYEFMRNTFDTKYVEEYSDKAFHIAATELKALHFKKNPV